MEKQAAQEIITAGYLAGYMQKEAEPFNFSSFKKRVKGLGAEADEWNKPINSLKRHYSSLGDTVRNTSPADYIKQYRNVWNDFKKDVTSPISAGSALVNNSMADWQNKFKKWLNRGRVTATLDNH